MNRSSGTNRSSCIWQKLLLLILQELLILQKQQKAAPVDLWLALCLIQYVVLGPGKEQAEAAWSLLPLGFVSERKGLSPHECDSEAVQNGTNFRL